jgi:hypothetical protein
MKSVSASYGDGYFGEDGQTYVGADGMALFGWDCGGGQGSYFENGCMGSGAKDCRDPAGLVDGCEDYRNCCTSSAWVGQMLSAYLLGAKAIWNHDAYFDYVDRWMTGDVDGANGSSAFAEAMWALYRDSAPPLGLSATCGDGGGAGEAGASSGGDGATTGGGTGSAGRANGGSATGGRATGTGGTGGTSGTSAVGGRASGATGGTTGGAGTTAASGGSTRSDGAESGCGCRTAPRRAPKPASFVLLGLALAAGLRRAARRGTRASA